MFTIQVAVAGAQMQLKDLVCNATMFGQFVTVDRGEGVMTDLQTQLCDLPADVLQEAERLFITQLDFTKFFTVGISGHGIHNKCYHNVWIFFDQSIVEICICFSVN